MINRILRGFPPRRLCVKFFSKFLFSQVQDCGQILPCEAGCYAPAFPFPPETAGSRPEAGGAVIRKKQAIRHGGLLPWLRACNFPTRKDSLTYYVIRKAMSPELFIRRKKKSEARRNDAANTMTGRWRPLPPRGKWRRISHGWGNTPVVPEENDSCEIRPGCRRIRVCAEKQAVLSEKQIGWCSLPEKTCIPHDAGQKGQPGKPGALFRPWSRRRGR